MIKKKDLDKIGFLDIVLRDEFNIPIFSSKKKKAGETIKRFEKFCEEKLGVKSFNAREFEEKLEKKYKVKGVGFRL